MIPRDALLSVKRIASKANPRVKDWASLSERKARRELGLTIAEGAKLASEGLRAEVRFRPVTLLVSDAGAERPGAGEIFADAARLGVERVSLTDDCYAKAAGVRTGDGLALVMAVGEGDGANAFADFRCGKAARWLVAAAVQDPGNAGALARTALAAGFDAALFLDGADSAGPKFLRGSMGAAFRLPCLAMGTEEFAAAWRSLPAGRLVVATAGAGGTDFRRADYTPPLAVVVGGERGVPPEILALPHMAVHIPLSGGVESLNLAVAAGVILFTAAGRPG